MIGRPIFFFAPVEGVSTEKVLWKRPKEQKLFTEARFYLHATSNGTWVYTCFCRQWSVQAPLDINPQIPRLAFLPIASCYY